MNKRILLNFLVLFSMLLLATNAFAILDSGQIKIFAVTEDEKGMAADLFLYSIPGDGEVAFITSNSLVGKDTQTTGNIALKIAQKKTGVAINQNNFIFDIKANASEVDGPSAGAAMTLLAYSLLSEKKIQSDIGITGTINSDGSVGMVGGVYAKAQAASEIGIKLLMIPKGEASQVIKETGKVVSINLLEYGPDNLGMKIVEVGTIDEVLKFAYSSIDSIKVDTTVTSSYFVPEAIQYKPALEPMKQLSKNYIERAKSAISDAKKELEVTTLDDATRSTFYSKIGGAERDIELAQIYLDQNYLYSAANYAFNSTLTALTIKEISANPSLLEKDSTILNSMISSLRVDIKSTEEKADFIPFDKIEWIIGAQQRIAYAKNALSTAEQVTFLPTDDSETIEEGLIKKVYDFVSAEAWTTTAKDFIIEAQKSNLKKQPMFKDDFVSQVKTKILSVEQTLIDSNIPSDIVRESQRRIDSAKISFDNNFFFAALYDAYFADSFVQAYVERKDLDPTQLLDAMEKKVSDSHNLNSFWANVYLDHAKFFLQNAIFEKSSERQNNMVANLETGYDLAILSNYIESANEIVDNYLSNNQLQDYVSSKPIIDIQYTKVDSISNYLVILLVALIILLVALITIGIKSRKRVFINYSKADKLNALLNRLDKALSQKKITDTEYFFMKKKYESEFSQMKNFASERSKITLNIDESRAKLRALERGMKDLKKHYRAGLILPTDYEKSLTEDAQEIVEIRKQISDYENELKNKRGSFNRRKSFLYSCPNDFKSSLEKSSRKRASSANKLSFSGKVSKSKKPIGARRLLHSKDSSVKGTKEIEKEQIAEEKREERERKRLIKKSKE